MTSGSLPRANGSGGLPAASASGSGPIPRDALAAVVRPRPRVGPILGLVLALGFAAVVAPAITADSWLGVSVHANRPSPITVRVPPFAGAEDGPHGGGIVVGRGEVPGLSRAAEAQGVLAHRPSTGSALAAYFAILFALAAIYSHHCRRSNRGRLLRVQLVNLGVLAAAAVGVKVLMLLTTVSVLAVPVALAAIIPTLVFDRHVGLATGVLAAIVMSLVVPFDLGVATILLAQASVGGLIVPDRQRAPVRAALLGACAAAIGAALTYGIYVYLSTGAAPWPELAHPMQSPWVAAVTGGALTLALAAPAIPLYQVLVGEITHGALVRLEDLAHPMLRQIATKAPGTWQHSLAMANMAELAANAIGASGRLVRVGAYFHDLGKSLQPKYFIENLEAGEVSPHEKLPPEVSCDAIFAHVTEGLTVARRAKLPERIVDFMHMHHGNGVLEYFWARCQEQGNPNRRTVEDFRYPGVPPQSRETAILAICDAVEAASRTLKRADEQTIGSLVQRIVYGKLHLGQLDDSGLSMADLRRISDSLRETIKHAHHGRIEYPWQKAEAAAEAAASGATTAPSPPKESTTARLMKEPRLDSLDAPRPMWQRAATESSPPAGTGAGSGPIPTQIGVATTAVLHGRNPEESGPTPLPMPMPAEPSGRAQAAPVSSTQVGLPSRVDERTLAAMAETGRLDHPSSPPPSSPVVTVRGREAPPGAGKRPAPMTPSEAAISVAPTFPPDQDSPMNSAGSGRLPAAITAPPPIVEIEAGPLPEEPIEAPIRPSASAIATPSRVMASMYATPVVGVAPTTLPGVTTDKIQPKPLDERVTAQRPSQPRPAELGDTVPPPPALAKALRDSGEHRAVPRTTPPSPPPGKRDSRPPTNTVNDVAPAARRELPVDYFPPPVDDAPSGDVLAASPRPRRADSVDDTTEPSVIGSRPRRQRQPAMIVDDPRPPAPPPPDAEADTTMPRMPAFRPSPAGAALPLPAPPTSDAEIPVPDEPKRRRRTSEWGEGLADRIDRAFEDEVANSTPVESPSPSAIASLAGHPETTKLTPLYQIEELVRESVSEDTADEDVELFAGWDRNRNTIPQATVDADGNPFDAGPAGGRKRRAPPTEEVDADAIEASIQEVPRVASNPDGPIVGPPPSTRPSTTSRMRRIKPSE
jgi:cyclic-di-AMP phosphodiesterase PgpH